MPPGVTASAEFSEAATGRASAVGKARRQIVLQSADGQVARVDVPEQVRNFDQIAEGDTVRLNYRVQFDIRVAGHEPPILGAIVSSATTGAPLGQKPAGLSTVTRQHSVQIVGVDRTSHTVTFRQPDGSLDSFVVQNPANYALADGLRPGTIVDVTETDAIAVSVSKI